MTAWSLVPIFALATSGLSVESLSPDALCPPQEDTRRAVEARLGQIELEGTWRATYVLVHRTRGDFVSLQLFDPAGTLKLERQLPVQSGSCATLSDVIALVLERFFLRPDELSDAPSVPDLPSKQAKDASSPDPAAERTAPTAPSQPAVPPPSKQIAAAPPKREMTSAASPPPRRFRAGAELWASTSWIAPSLRLERDLGDRYRLGVGAGFDLVQHRSSVFEGSALVRRIPLSVSADALWTVSSSLRARAGLQLLGLFEVARTQALADSGHGVRLVPGLGTRVGAELFPEAAAQPFIELTAAWIAGFFAPPFQVGTREVLTPPSFVLGVSIGISTPF